MKTYKSAPMDKLTLGVTIFALGLFLFVEIGMMVPFGRTWPIWLQAGFVILLVALCWQVKARRCEMRENSIVIVRGWPFKDIVIPLSEVREVRRFNFTLLTIRSFGVGGLFSATGFFWNKEVGSFFASVTDLKRAVLIEANQKVVVSPEDADQFMADVKSVTEGRT